MLTRAHSRPVCPRFAGITFRGSPEPGARRKRVSSGSRARPAAAADRRDRTRARGRSRRCGARRSRGSDRAGRPAMSSFVTITERSISAGSRPIASQCSSSTRHLWAITSGAPNACQVDGPLRDEPQHDLLAAAADQHRDRAAHGRRVELAQALVDHRQRIAECAQPRDRASRTRSRTRRSRARTSPNPARGSSGRPEMWSTVRAMSASRLGLRYELQVTSAPNWTRSVASAIAASRLQHSKCAPVGDRRRAGRSDPR